jgi:hypothetical protein
MPVSVTTKPAMGERIIGAHWSESGYGAQLIVTLRVEGQPAKELFTLTQNEAVRLYNTLRHLLPQVTQSEPTPFDNLRDSVGTDGPSREDTS